MSTTAELKKWSELCELGELCEPGDLSSRGQHVGVQQGRHVRPPPLFQAGTLQVGQKSRQYYRDLSLNQQIELALRITVEMYIGFKATFCAPEDNMQVLQ